MRELLIPACEFFPETGVMDPGLISLPSGARTTTQRSVRESKDSTKLSASKLSSFAQPVKQQATAATQSADTTARVAAKE